MTVDLKMPSYEKAEITDLTVALEPVQENDYDSVWPAGGGKNLLEWANPTNTINGVTFTVNSDGSVLVNGTANGGDSSFYSNTDAHGWFTMKAGEYVISGCPAGGSSTTYLINEVVKGRQDTGNGIKLTLDEDTNIRLRIVIRNGYTANNLLFKPMIRLSSIADGTFAPYSNICPITGHSEVNVYNGAVYGTADDTYTISLGGTYYGGTLDVLSGVLTVEWENIDSYAGETLPGKWISDRDVYASGTTPTTGAQVAYELATPITVQLTAQDVETLTGINNVWSDSGDVTVTISGITQTGDVVTFTALPQHKIQLFMP